MLANQFHEAVAAVRSTTQLDTVARQLWAAHGQGAIADADAEAIAGAVQARRAAFARPAMSIALSQAAPAYARRKPVRPRSPDRQASLERRRRCAMSGIVPARIATSFTLSEVAALSVIAREVKKAGVCILPVDAIAALAGISRTTTQNALRLAEHLGLILRIERRRRGLPSLPNILRIVASEWVTWLRHGSEGRGGLKKLSATNNHYLSKRKVRTTGGTDWHLEATHGRVKREQAAGESGYISDEGSCKSKSKAPASGSAI